MGSSETEKVVLGLYREGAEMIHAVSAADDEVDLDLFSYQSWYTRALRVVEALAPDRLSEFRGCYEVDPKRKRLDYSTYTLQDYFKGVVPAYTDFDRQRQGLNCFVSQLAILKSLVARIDSVLGNIHAAIAAELQDSHLDTARTLLKVNCRAAGALAGVVLETHLQQVAKVQGVSVRKKHPTIADLNEPLKAAGAYDLAAWRKIAYLGDIRNLCTHKKGTDPTVEQVTELIDGVAWALGNV